ncbi:hypothetical protein WA158_002860 [Blastocystis sp. Blastoise]
MGVLTINDIRILFCKPIAEVDEYVSKIRYLLETIDACRSQSCQSLAFLLDCIDENSLNDKCDSYQNLVHFFVENKETKKTHHNAIPGNVSFIGNQKKFIYSIKENVLDLYPNSLLSRQSHDAEVVDCNGFVYVDCDETYLGTVINTLSGYPINLEGQTIDELMSLKQAFIDLNISVPSKIDCQIEKQKKKQINESYYQDMITSFQKQIGFILKNLDNMQQRSPSNISMFHEITSFTPILSSTPLSSSLTKSPILQKRPFSSGFPTSSTTTETSSCLNTSQDISESPSEGFSGLFCRTQSSSISGSPSNVMLTLNTELSSISPRNIQKQHSSLLTEDLFQYIYKWLGNKTEWYPIYIGSRDGFTASTFHRLCDNHGEALVIIKTKNNNSTCLFGGYTSTGWKPKCGTFQFGIYDPKAFLFSLQNPYNIPPTLFPTVNNNYLQLEYDINSGPIFSLGLYIKDRCNQHNMNFVYVNEKEPIYGYNDTYGASLFVNTGKKKDKNYFKVDEIEVLTRN